jgi:hypothetical protein
MISQSADCYFPWEAVVFLTAAEILNSMDSNALVQELHHVLFIPSISLQHLHHDYHLLVVRVVKI